MSGRYVARKFLGAVITIFAIVILNFVLFRMMPGSPDRVSKNPHLTPEIIAANRARWGLDKPLIPDQLVDYIADTATGDLGYSIKYRGQPVTEVVLDATGPDGPAHRRRRGDRHRRRPVARGAVRLAARRHHRPGRQRHQPGAVLDALLRDRHAADHRVRRGPALVPDLGHDHARRRPDARSSRSFDIGRHLVLPLTAVAIGLIGAYSILMRSSIIETRAEDYITTARAKGLSDDRILNSHAFPNALLPMVTLIAINLGYVVAGAITAEIVFNWPGLGTLTVQALDARDYPLLQAIFLLIAVSVVFANFIADIVYGYLDPRVRT